VGPKFGTFENGGVIVLAHSNQRYGLNRLSPMEAVSISPKPKKLRSYGRSFGFAFAAPGVTCNTLTSSERECSVQKAADK